MKRITPCGLAFALLSGFGACERPASDGRDRTLSEPVPAPPIPDRDSPPASTTGLDEYPPVSGGSSAQNEPLLPAPLRLPEALPEALEVAPIPVEAIVATPKQDAIVRLLAYVHRLDVDQVALANLALGKIITPKLKEFAEMSAADHGAADVKVLGYAAKHQVDLSSIGRLDAGALSSPVAAAAGLVDMINERRLAAASKKLYDDLDSLHGTKFADAYIEAMVGQHEDALSRIRETRKALDAPDGSREEHGAVAHDKPLGEARESGEWAAARSEFLLLLDDLQMLFDKHVMRARQLAPDHGT